MVKINSVYTIQYLVVVVVVWLPLDTLFFTFLCDTLLFTFCASANMVNYLLEL